MNKINILIFFLKVSRLFCKLIVQVRAENIKCSKIVRNFKLVHTESRIIFGDAYIII